MRLILPIAAVLAALVLAAPAVAQYEVIAPPGNSGVEEYLEVVPGAGGDKPTGGARSGNRTAPTPAEALGADNARALEALGVDGKAAAAAAAAGSPTNRKSSRERDKSNVLGESATDQSIAATSGGDRVASAARALGGDGGGMGVLFPILLGLTLSLAVAVGVGRLLRSG